jgi:OmcA/MtrC family decaheme c-type cytochrome
MGGPTTDYSIQPFRERGDHSSFDGTTATYTFTHAIPADATGSWAFTIEARRDVAVTYPPPGATTIREGAVNPVYYANLSGGTPDPRRTVIDMANCNTCHDQLTLHGGQRFAAEECVICHNPNGDDSSQRPADQGPAESIDFKRLIHRIHTGEEMTQNFTIYGFGGSVNNFNEVRFPGDRRVCTICHVDGTQQVQETMPPGRLPTVTARDYYSPQQPTAAACLGCHDTQAAAAHAFVMTAPFGEACAVCHGPDTDFAVDKVHAQ